MFEPDIDVFVHNSSETLVQSTLPSSQVRSFTFAWDALPTVPSPLQFSAQGSGPVYFTVALDAITAPSPNVTRPRYGGLHVTKVIRQRQVRALAPSRHFICCIASQFLASAVTRCTHTHIDTHRHTHRHTPQFGFGRRWGWSGK